MVKNFCQPLVNTDEHLLQVFMLADFFKTPHGMWHASILTLMADIRTRILPFPLTILGSIHYQNPGDFRRFARSVPFV